MKWAVAFSGRRFHQSQGGFIGFAQFAPVHPVDDQLRSRRHQIGIESQSAFQRSIGVLEHLLSTIRIGCVIVIALPDLGPRGGVLGIKFYRAFERPDGISIGSGIMRRGYAAQIKIVSFLIVGTSAGFEKSGSRSQDGQQASADLLGQLLLHAQSGLALIR